MPKVTIWIRDEDYLIWQSIEDKPQWLHDSFQQQLADWKGEHQNDINQQ